MSKILLALRSPGNWALVLMGAAADLNQIGPCLSGHWKDAAATVVVIIGIVVNTMHLEKALKTVPPALPPIP